eukprot:gnl/TRDRNA2_/TRDRNA2_27576_c0_seq1.p1 gnl/TRDRNA2_/TRDRNA2_27576_c0~~gnl/TRDRNA2_/TRDRNA2_27576_c0_seq1.p1  ORF type:complete len:342 (+),score=50.55 gnl/TRDRNA2_/TRDRNA2_27576_c0_seq1:77-1102(+)
MHSVTVGFFSALVVQTQAVLSWRTTPVTCRMLPTTCDGMLRRWHLQSGDLDGTTLRKPSMGYVAALQALPHSRRHCHNRQRPYICQSCLQGLDRPMDSLQHSRAVASKRRVKISLGAAVQATNISVTVERQHYAKAMQQRTPHVTLKECDELSTREPTAEAVFIPVHKHYMSQVRCQCVPTTTAMLMKFEGNVEFGDPRTLFNLAHDRPIDSPMSKKDKDKTTSYKLMSQALEASGINVSFGGPWACDDAGFQEGFSMLKSRLREGKPSIVDVRGLYSRAHSVIVVGFGEYAGKKVVYVLDSCFAAPPEAPVWALDIADFESIWGGAVLDPEWQVRHHMFC